MAHAPAAAAPTTGHQSSEPATPARVTPLQHPPISPGKFAMWLFLATEVMFFTGLIGSYIVLRAGSVPTAYSNFFPPGTDLSRKTDVKGVRLVSLGEASASSVAGVIHQATGKNEHEVEHLVESAHSHPVNVLLGVKAAEAEKVKDQLKVLGAEAEIEPLRTYNWPVPYDEATNPLSIDLTAANTFILICSSVSMVLALAAIQRGDRTRFIAWLACTTVVGACFLGVQVYEYRQLFFNHVYPAGVSTSTHFTPNVSLFASCFFTMTGFHGAHVAGGVVMLASLLIGALLGKFSKDDYSAVELIGLYWHFVDLVWIILFTVVYLL